MIGESIESQLVTSCGSIFFKSHSIKCTDVKCIIWWGLTNVVHTYPDNISTQIKNISTSLESFCTHLMLILIQITGDCCYDIYHHRLVLPVIELHLKTKWNLAKYILCACLSQFALMTGDALVLLCFLAVQNCCCSVLMNNISLSAFK